MYTHETDVNGEKENEILTGRMPVMAKVVTLVKRTLTESV